MKTSWEANRVRLYRKSNTENTWRNKSSGKLRVTRDANGSVKVDMINVLTLKPIFSAMVGKGAGYGAQFALNANAEYAILWMARDVAHPTKGTACMERPYMFIFKNWNGAAMFFDFLAKGSMEHPTPSSSAAAMRPPVKPVPAVSSPLPATRQVSNDADSDEESNSSVRSDNLSDDEVEIQETQSQFKDSLYISHHHFKKNVTNDQIKEAKKLNTFF